MANVDIGGEGKKLTTEDLFFKEVSDSDEEGNAFFDKKIDEELDKMEAKEKEEAEKAEAEEKKEGENQPVE